MSATDTLAPCPFCDGMAMLDESEDGFWAAVCADCVATTEYETATEAATAWNRRAPAQPSQEAVEKARGILAASPAILGQRNHRDLMSGIAAALTATHAKAEAEGYARGIEDAAKVCDAGLDVIADQPAPDGRPNNQAILLQHRTGMGVALREAAKHIRALSPPTASAKAASDEVKK